MKKNKQDLVGCGISLIGIFIMAVIYLLSKFGKVVNLLYFSWLNLI
jgi:hypothetical protein